MINEKYSVYKIDFSKTVPELKCAHYNNDITFDSALFIGSSEDFIQDDFSAEFYDAINKADKLFTKSFTPSKIISNNKEIFGILCDKADLTDQELKRIAQKAAKSLGYGDNVNSAIILGESFISIIPKISTLLMSIYNELPLKDNRFKQNVNKVTSNYQSITIVTPNNFDLYTLNNELDNLKIIFKNFNYAKILANTPSNIATPEYIANEAKEISNTLGTKIEIFDEENLKRINANAYLSVAKGSSNKPYMSILTYKGTDPNEAPIAFVGKGLTFDSGGLSLKPAASMDEMMFDKCGAVNVLALFKTIVELKLKINVVAVLACAENMPDGGAYKPGDIIETRSGQTVEILNTDAEGRLVLCDALDYVKTYKPKTIVDIATLTGACVVALGKSYTGFFTNSERLALEVNKASFNSNDLAWRLPFGELYNDNVTPVFGDIGNSGPRWGGSSNAAQFLSKFVDCPWIHLDIAGTAWLSDSKKGATGRPIMLLIELLNNLIK